MLFYDVFEEIILNQASQIKENFKNFYINDESLHDLRVALRRLLSYFLCFRNYINFDKQLLNNARFFLKASNKARDTQILIEKINDLDIFDIDLKELKTYLEKECIMQKSEFYNILSLTLNDFLTKLNYTLAQKNYKKNEFLNCNFEEIIYLSLEKQVKKIKKIRPKAKSLHKLRIEYKKYRYILEILQDKTQTQIIQKQLNKLKQLQDKLGYIQDLIVHIDYLKSLKEILLDSVDAINALIDTFKDNIKQKKKKIIFLLSFYRYFETNWSQND